MKNENSKEQFFHPTSTCLVNVKPNQSSTPRPIFAYGTLMNEKVYNTVVKSDNKLVTKCATLKNFHRYTVEGKSYPGIISKEGSTVEGCVIFPQSTDHVKLLDYFEGNEYIRNTVSVVLKDQTELEVDVYVYLRPHLLSKNDWTMEYFNQTFNL